MDCVCVELMVKATHGMDYDFQFSSAYFDREKNCRKSDMTRSDSFIKEIKAQFDTQENVIYRHSSGDPEPPPLITSSVT